MTTQTLKIVCSLVYVIIAIVNAALPSKLPKGFVQCKKSDTAFDDCIKDGIQKAIPHLVKGVPSLGLIKIDPLRIAKLEIDQGTGPVNIQLKFKDLDIINLKSIVITKVKSDLANYSLDFEVVPKSLILSGLYDVSGKVLVLPIVGNGKCKINLDFSKIVGSVQMKPMVTNSVTYLNIEKLTLKSTVSNMRIKLDNLFNGDKALGDNMNVFLNENWRDLLIELQPAIEQAFGAAFTEIGQQVLKRVPFNQLFKE